MAKLDRELTEKFFNCTDAEDVIKVVNEANSLGKDLETASRVSIDEVLNKFYQKRCTGTKKHAIEMLLGAIRGENIPDIPTTPSVYKQEVTLDQYSKELAAEGEERFNLIKQVIEEFITGMKKYYDYTEKILKKSPRLRALRSTDEDLIEIGRKSLIYVAGRDKSGKIYLMKREPKRMEEATKYKWDLFL